MTRPPRFSEWRPHPWHGLPAGREPPLYVNAYVEITPFDFIKYGKEHALRVVETAMADYEVLLSSPNPN